MYENAMKMYKKSHSQAQKGWVALLYDTRKDIYIHRVNSKKLSLGGDDGCCEEGLLFGWISLQESL